MAKSILLTISNITLDPSVLHNYTDWQISSNQSFTNIVFSSINDIIDRNNKLVYLDNPLPLYFRYRLGLSVGATEWFTVDVAQDYIASPTITINSDMRTLVGDINITTTPFTCCNTSIQHTHTEWILYNSRGRIIWSDNSTINLTSNALPADIIFMGESYKLRVRHISDDVSSIFTMLNFTNIPIVITTPILYVENEPNFIPLDPILATSSFNTNSGTDIHVSTDWAIEDLNNTVVWSSLNNSIDLTTINVPLGELYYDESYKIKVRHNGNVVSSIYAIELHSTGILPVIDTPTLTVQGEPGDIVLEPILTTSAFNMSTGTDTHVSTDWVIEDNVGNVLWQSSADTVNLTTITVPANILVNGASYVFKVRYNGTTTSSMLVSETHNTPALPIINPPLLAVEGEPNSVPITPILVTNSFSMLSGTDTHTSTDWVIEDTTGNVVWQSLTNTVNITTITVPTATLTGSTVYTFRVRHNGAVVSSGWTNELHTTITLIINAWTSVANYPTVIYVHSQSTLPDGRVLVVGGQNNGGVINLSNIYNPETNVWSSAANYPMAIRYHSQSTLLDGRVLVVGGLIATGRINLAHIYNPTTNAWSSVANYPTVIGHHAQSTLPDGRVLVVGGLGTTGRTNVANIYNPESNVWTSVANYPMALWRHSQSTLLDGRVLVVGGGGASRTNVANIYDPGTNVWTSVANYPTILNQHSQSTLIDGRVLVVCGWNSAGITNLANIYNPETNVWASVANYPMIIGQHAQSTLPDGGVLVVGGFNNAGATNIANIYTP